MSTPPNPSSKNRAGSFASIPWLHYGLGVAWIATACGLSTRHHLVFRYEVLVFIPGLMEPFGADLLIILLMFGLACCGLALLRRPNEAERWKEGPTSKSLRWLGLSLFPLVLSSLRSLGIEIQATLLEPLGFATCTGIAIACGPVRSFDRYRALAPSIVATACTLAFAWFWMQSHFYWENFQLGFNDFGQFALRVSNTSAGRGFLRESPVLPAFWDHFNPMLLSLVPLWKLWPSMDLIFTIQAACLAGSGWLVYHLARSLKVDSTTAALWSLAWLLHPSLSQMNLAYTYGWHPISFAIPALLLALSMSIRRHRWGTLTAVVIAVLTEESAIVILSLWCGCRAVRSWLAGRLGFPQHSLLDSGWGYRRWLMWSILFGMLFAIVFRFSGLAPFQTSRFADLGSSPQEVLLSPIFKPHLFWGHLFEFRSFAFALCLFLPWIPSRWYRSIWCWLPTVLPMVVLLVWNHAPAKSLAFQYVSTLLPFWIVAAIVGTLERKPGHEVDETILSDERPGTLSTWQQRGAFAAMICSGMTSIFLGQLPWSSPTLTDVMTQSYGIESKWNRKAHEEDGKWLLGTVAKLRSENGSVLATGRIAAHLVGVPDLETVGQFVERRERLGAISPGLDSVLKRYDTIILDRTESFQQSRESSRSIENEARNTGFHVEADRFDIIVLRKDPRL